MDFLKRVLNAHLAVTLLVWLSATTLLAFRSIPPDVWKDVVNTCLLVFVGGGILKEGINAIVPVASNRQVQQIPPL